MKEAMLMKLLELCLRLFFPLMALVSLALSIAINPYAGLLFVATMWLLMGKVG